MLFLENMIYFIIASVLIFGINWKHTLISVVTLPAIAVLAVRLEKKINVAYEKASDQRVLLNRTAQENLSGVRVVKALRREKYEIEKFMKENEKNCRLNIESTLIYSTYHSY